ncbi:hypothetical protein CEK25_002418 [Fusarium fujikuroi]|nr:hypothetical protein CEK25_002418 [Fusarium fujikuroi]
MVIRHYLRLPAGLSARYLVLELSMLYFYTADGMKSPGHKETHLTLTTIQLGLADLASPGYTPCPNRDHELAIFALTLSAFSQVVTGTFNPDFLVPPQLISILWGAMSPPHAFGDLSFDLSRFYDCASGIFVRSEP